MKRVVLMSAASAFCLLWAAGCASTEHPDAKPAAAATLEKPVDENPSASSDIATLSRNLPGTMEGEMNGQKMLTKFIYSDWKSNSFVMKMMSGPNAASLKDMMTMSKPTSCA